MIPVYGQGFFTISYGIINYIIVFDYIDDKGEYRRIMGDRELIAKEENVLRENMQRLMDEERVIINSLEVRPVVEKAFIELRGSGKRVSITFYTSIPFKPNKGRNIYENFYESTIAEYPYRVYWIALPCIKIESIESPGLVIVNDNISLIQVDRGTRIDGYESVVFTIRDCPELDRQP